MIIDCISDLHGHYPNLEGGDLLIVAGDLTARSTIRELDYFNNWIREQEYKKKVVVAGNHDTFFEKGVYNPFDVSTHNPKSVFIDTSCDYLCDSGDEFEGLKIWGSPWTKTFPGMNPRCKAFTLDTEEELAEKWVLIPDDVDILVTHGPPYGILDRTVKRDCVGSKSLQMEIFKRIRPKLFVCGHVHESYGIEPKGGFLENAVNACIMNERYQPVNKPIRIEL